MRIARALAVGAAAAALVTGVAVGSPAQAAPVTCAEGVPCETDVTFDVTAGVLEITVPDTAALGTGTPGTAINGSLGDVTVTDGRASADASWDASVTATVFQTGTGTPTETILASEVDYWSGPLITSTGTGAFVPGQPAFVNRAPLDNVTPLIAFSHTGGTGNNTATWNPDLSINVPLDSEAGTYTGTVAHSVA